MVRIERRRATIEERSEDDGRQDCAALSSLDGGKIRHFRVDVAVNRRRRFLTMFVRLFRAESPKAGCASMTATNRARCLALSLVPSSGTYASGCCAGSGSRYPPAEFELDCALVLLPRPESALSENLTEELRLVGHDPVDTKIKETLHLVTVVDRPYVHCGTRP